MFRFYLKYILNNVENSKNLDGIINANNKMLYRFSNNKTYIGGGNSTPVSEEIKQFEQSTISIVESLKKPINEQRELITKSKNAIVELIKYIELLYKIEKKDELLKINQQLLELGKKIESISQ
jgi:hypothetical protein